jgi:hypothetical protein
VYNCCWCSPAQSFPGPSPVGLVTIFCCCRFETSQFDCLSYGLCSITQREPKRNHYLQQFAYYIVLSVATKCVSIPWQRFDFYQRIHCRGTCLPNHCRAMADSVFQVSCHNIVNTLLLLHCCSLTQNLCAFYIILTICISHVLCQGL